MGLCPRRVRAHAEGAVNDSRHAEAGDERREVRRAEKKLELPLAVGLVELQFVSLPTEEEALEAYTQSVIAVAERLSPSVANVRLRRDPPCSHTSKRLFLCSPQLRPRPSRLRCPCSAPRLQLRTMAAFGRASPTH